MSGFKPNAGQRDALDALTEWWFGSTASQVFVLHGYAGTGKTTVIRHFAESRGISIKPIAPTGKAASLWEDGQTLHRFVYNVVDDPLEGLKNRAARAVGEEREKLLAEIVALRPTHPLEFQRLDNEDDDGPVPLVVLDEACMVREEDAHALLGLGYRIVALGDPFQLPPVGGDPARRFATPDATLTEVMRSGAGSDIPKLAERIRLGDDLTLGSMVRLLKADGRYQPEAADEADIVLSGRRADAASYNARRVGVLERTPELGDLVVSLNNSRALYNGQRFHVLAGDRRDGRFKLHLVGVDRRVAGGGLVRWTGEADPAAFLNPEGEKEVSQQLPTFAWGYAVTVNKAQGSEWEHVHLLPNWQSNYYGARGGFIKQGYAERAASAAALLKTRRLLYTAVTRARARFTYG